MARGKTRYWNFIGNKVHKIIVDYDEMTAHTDCGLDVSKHIDDFGATNTADMEDHCKRCYKR